MWHIWMHRVTQLNDLSICKHMWMVRGQHITYHKSPLMLALKIKAPKKEKKSPSNHTSQFPNCERVTWHEPVNHVTQLNDLSICKHPVCSSVLQAIQSVAHCMTWQYQMSISTCKHVWMLRREHVPQQKSNSMLSVGKKTPKKKSYQPAMGNQRWEDCL